MAPCSQRSLFTVVLCVCASPVCCRRPVYPVPTIVEGRGANNQTVANTLLARSKRVKERPSQRRPIVSQTVHRYPRGSTKTRPQRHYCWEWHARQAKGRPARRRSKDVTRPPPPGGPPSRERRGRTHSKNSKLPHPAHPLLAPFCSNLRNPNTSRQ